MYLLRGAKTALVDTGTATAAPRLLEALRGVRIDYVFVTHVHLDHAGGAGHLARAHPEAVVVASPRALPHLADPARLVAGVRAASPTLSPFYGEPLPIDLERVIACADGQSFALGRGAALLAVETPGHAPHHVCFFEHATRTLFAGDAVGQHGAPVDLPLTVPPRFDLAASRASIARLADLRPRLLAFTHYGIARAVSGILKVYSARVDEWLARVVAIRAYLGPDPDAVANEVLADPRYASLSPASRAVAHLCVRGALLTLEHDDADRQAVR